MKFFLELQNGVESCEAKYFNNGLLKNTDIGTREKQETKEESLISIKKVDPKMGFIFKSIFEIVRIECP
ncbi:MAG: hypothetical protein ACRC5W_02680 [Cetobacterium sp.]